MLGYNVLVVLWGGVVRASGSGAGCGDHWPFCNGEILPSNPALNTLVEFAHRVTSGLALPLVFWLVWQAFRQSAPGAAVRKAATAAGAFIVLEAALGAGLVLFRYVAYNPSIARAGWMAAHLVNTLLLLGALALVAGWASGAAVPRRVPPGRAVAVGAALAAVLVLAVGGAVTALGDTLVVGGGLDPARDPVVAALVSVRLFHPLMAFVALGVVSASVWQSRSSGQALVSRGMTVLGLFVAQMGIGALNVGLLVPVWLQIVHLLMTDLIWISLVLWATEALLGVTLGIGHVDQFDIIILFRGDRLGGADIAVEPSALAHHGFGLLGIVPQGRILDAGVELVQPPQRALPVERTADQFEGGVDAIDQGLRFCAHGWAPENWVSLAELVDRGAM